jgi:hypothetical protein
LILWSSQAGRSNADHIRLALGLGDDTEEKNRERAKKDMINARSCDFSTSLNFEPVAATDSISIASIKLHILDLCTSKILLWTRYSTYLDEPTTLSTLFDMVRSAKDATRFTATTPYASAKPQGQFTPAPVHMGQAAPSGETPQQKIARLRAAAARARTGKESNFDAVVRVGRRWADRAHRVTAYSLIGLTGTRYVPLLI